VRQGGTGDTHHASGYVHKYPTLQEAGEPVGDAVTAIQKGEPSVFQLNGLVDFFDEPGSVMALDTQLMTSVDSTDLVRKALYDFDVDSREGVVKLLELLPIMDTEILQEIAGEIWPGYPAQDSDSKLLRAEIKGYLMDYLDEE